MGIRFQCPNGHKINVKAFLAGKRALCPECGTKVVVPLDSDGAVPANAAKSNGAAEAAAAMAATERTASPVVASAPAAAKFAATAAPVSAHAAPAISPTFSANLAAAAAVVAAPTIPSAIAVDPIAEAPQAVWYVRPRSGGQYGPAPGDVFRQWIAQRRVTADSLVWRDGWTDWRLASEALPQFASRTAPAFAPLAAGAGAATASPIVADAAAAAATANNAALYVRTRRSKSSTVAAICVLGVVAIALVAALIYVLNRPL